MGLFSKKNKKNKNQKKNKKNKKKKKKITNLTACNTDFIGSSRFSTGNQKYMTLMEHLAS